MDKLQSIKYTVEHKKAFLKVEKELLGKNTLRGYLHDVDKLFLYLFMDKKKAHKIHQSYAKHHVQNMVTQDDMIQGIIDWECCRYTKPDKPLTALEFIPKLKVSDGQKAMLTMIANGLGLVK
jgi:hypothetical protein